MLLLSRKEGERIIISGQGRTIVLTVVGFRGRKVRIGIDAPADITVHREEVQRQIERGEAPGRGRA